MDADERRALHAADKALHREALARAANPEPVEAARQAPPVVVEPRSYDDGRWSPPPLMRAELEPVHAPQQPPPLPAPTHSLTDAEAQRWQRYIDDRIVAAVVAYHESKEMRPVTDAVIQGIGVSILNKLAREAEEIDGLRSEHDLRIAALLQTTSKLERSLDAVTREVAKRQIVEATAQREQRHGGEVIDMVQPLGRRRA